MTKNKKDLIFLLMFLFFINAALRIFLIFSTSAPLNDGGLFYTMINNLQENRWNLPLYTSYNQTNIPFAYPPFAFYFTAILASLTKISTFTLLRLLPPIISVFAIAAFYFLALQISNSETGSLLAAIIFSFTPLAFEWQIMGGGITRSFGQVFAILTWINLYEYYKTGNAKRAWRIILFGGLVLLAHPEAALQTAIGGIPLLIFASPSTKRTKNLVNSLLYAAIIGIVTSPWWGLIVQRFGFAPFLSVFEASRQNTIPFIARILTLFQFNFFDEPYITIISALGLLGLFDSLAQKRYLAPAWAFCALLIDLRSGARFATIPLAIMAGAFIENRLIPALNPQEKNSEEIEKKLLGSPYIRLFMGYLLVVSILGSYTTIQTIVTQKSLRRDQISAFQWIKDNTPIQSKFAMITQAQPLLDPTTEWMPALSERNAVNSIFGLEWKNGADFGHKTEAYNRLQICANKNIECVLNWEKDNEQFDFLIIQKKSSGNLLPLQIFIAQSNQFRLVFENSEMEIYKQLE